MKNKCNKCGIEEVGRYKKLIKKGWRIFFLFDGIKVMRCKKCSPTFKDKMKKVFNKNHKSDMYYDVENMINKMKLLKGLKTKEERIKESKKRIEKNIKKYHYQINIHKKKSSKKYG